MSSAAYNLVSKCPLKEILLVSTKNMTWEDHFKSKHLRPADYMEGL
jgi:hypothetical protein